MTLLNKAPRHVLRAPDPQKELRLLQKLILSISQASDLQAAIHMTLCNVCEMTGWSYGQAWQVSANHTALECCPAWNARKPNLQAFRKSVEQARLAPGEGLVGRAWVFRETIWTDDVAKDTSSPMTESARQAGFQSAIAIPVMAGDEALLVLEFYLLEPRMEDNNHIQLITAIATQLGWLIQKKMAEEALRESIERFELTERGSRDGLWDAKIPKISEGLLPDMPVYFSRRFKQLLGFTESEMRNVLEAWSSRIHPEDKRRVTEALSDHLKKTSAL